MLVLVTRPEAQAERTAGMLREAGHEVILDPVLEIRAVEPRPAIALTGIDAIAVTSANAAFAVAGLESRLPVYVVGGATAAACRAAGAAEVRQASGDGASLAARIAAEIPAPATVLHLAGRDVREGLEAGLQAAGIGYRAVAVYAACPSLRLRAETAAALARRRLDAVLLYSPRSAAHWADLVREAGLSGSLERVVAVCLSEAVAAPLAGLGLRAVRVAASRDQNALLRCLEAVR